MNPIRLLFLCSGGGGNLKFFHQLELRKVRFLERSFHVLGAICDRECGALEYASKNNIHAGRHSFLRINAENKKLIHQIELLSPDYIITNVFKVLSKEVVDQFSGMLVNLHYSLLPAFGGLIGMKTVEEAEKLNSSFFGTTCHLVNENVDAGKILAQSCTPRLQTTNPIQEVFETGCLTLLSGILLREEIPLEPTSVFKNTLISPAYRFQTDIFDEIFEELRTL